MIAKGGDFRPDDAINRAEMATFLIGLLAEAAPNVTIDSAGAIQLGTGSMHHGGRRPLRRRACLSAPRQ